ncbi:hypothetical protein JAAARDRAFT_480694 [Jaapia argillacea MUCL 33604]|uniref:Uncharacterized protein n=1 Tax=Jaapia argillacea MUCL 33604 TaxID=933084 RepID=A0A067PMS1_9AGAM|nr:hypothetical protein JAAARDRAFT_480694 [Jaapia argillacea MUCL 33604]
MVYQNFLREWSWHTGGPWLCDIVRAISPSRRKQLCHDLVNTTFSTSAHRFDDHVKWTESATRCFCHILIIAKQHVTCLEEILGILMEQSRDSDEDTRKQASGLKQALTDALRSRQDLSQMLQKLGVTGRRPWSYCFNHRRPICKDDKCWRLGLNLGLTRSKSLRLWFDHHYCSWVDAEALPSWSSAEVPLAKERNGLRQKWICCRELKALSLRSSFSTLSLGIQPFFAFSDDLHIPQLVASRTKGPIYVLVGRDRPDGSRPFLWEEEL